MSEPERRMPTLISRWFAGPRLASLAAAGLMTIYFASASAVVMDLEQLPSREQLVQQAAEVADFAPAVEALQRGDAAGAEELARRFVAKNPGNPRAHLLLILSWYPQLKDVAIADHLAEVDEALPDAGAALHESIAGLYLQDVRLYRATQHLNAIAPTRRSQQALFLEASIAARQTRLDDALRKYAELSREVPENPTIALNQARLALVAQDYATAEAAAQRLLKAQPGDEAGRLLLGTAQMQQGKSADARKSFAAVTEQNPRSSLAWLNLGLMDLAEGKTKAALTAFASARTAAIGDPRPIYGETAAALAAGDQAAARQSSSAARRVAPDDPLAGLLDSLARGESMPESATIASLNAAAPMFPDLARRPLPTVLIPEFSNTAAAAQLAVANVLAQLWSNPAALEWIARQKPALTPAPLMDLTRARAMAGSGDIAAASKLLAKLEGSPEAKGLVSPAILSAQAAARMNDKAAARAAMQRALAVAPDEGSVHRLAGDLENALGEPAGAIAEYRLALAAAPGDPRLQNQLAATLALVGGRAEYQEGLRLAETALAQKPDYMTRALLLDTRADLLYRLGRKPEALAAYRELSTTVGGITGPEAWQRLAELSLEAKDRAGARKAFEEALDYGRDYSQRARAMAELDALSPPGDGLSRSP